VASAPQTPRGGGVCQRDPGTYRGQLSATHRDEKGAPVAHDTELAAAIREQLQRVQRKHIEHADDTAPVRELPRHPMDGGVVMAEVIDSELPTQPADADRQPRDQARAAGGAASPSHRARARAAPKSSSISDSEIGARSAQLA
jgi:hypothetical protein